MLKQPSKSMIFCRILTVFILFNCTISSAQRVLENVSVKGVLVDDITKAPLEFATVTLFQMPQDSLVAGVLTKQDGAFSFEDVSNGNYKAKISYLGYKDSAIIINVTNKNINLGTIPVFANVSQLNEVTVVAEKSQMSLSIDRKVYNVEKDLSVNGGTGLDAVKNIPSVTIDTDGTVSLREGEVQIYINGRQTELTIEQIPADQIERIEVITNPSARFDANTSGGILNVVLKKNTKPGYNGRLSMGIGTNERYMPSFNFNVKKKPFNLTASYNYTSETNDNKGKTTRENLTNPVPIYKLDQNSLTDFRRYMHIGRVAVGVDLNQYNSFTLGGTYVNGTYHLIDDQTFFTYDASGNQYSSGTRNNDNKNEFEHYVTRLDYRKTFDKPNKEINVTTYFSAGPSKGAYTFNTISTETSTSIIENDIQKNVADGTSNKGVFQLDFTNPINDSTTLELGIKSSYGDRIRNNYTTNYSAVLSDFEYDSILSNNYQIKEAINAAYINYATKLKHIKMQAGLRFEHISYNGVDLKEGGEDFSYTYPENLQGIFNSLFPAVYFSKSVNDKVEIQANFSRKLNRPRFYYLLPIVFFADRYNYRIGNPALQPEFVNKAEFNYNYITEKINLLSSVYGQITENAILYGAFPSENDPNVLVNTFQNGGTSYTIGWENIARITFSKKLVASITATPFYLFVNFIDENNELLQNEGFSLKSKFMISYKLPKKFAVQVNGLYDAPKPVPQGNKTDLFFFDISLSKKIKKFTFVLTLSDVLDTKQRGTVYSTEDFEQFLIRRRESRYLKFRATWTFGKTDKKAHHHSSGGGGMMQD